MIQHTTIQPDYKPSLLGFVPNNWTEYSILDLAERKKIFFDDGDWIEAEFLTESGIRLVQTGNIGVGEFIDKDRKKYISEESYRKLKCKDINAGDILICRLADPAGRACILPEIGEFKMITSVDVSIFRPSEKLADRQFLTNIFSSEYWFKVIKERCGGSTRSRISRGALGKIKLPLPPLPEQKAIADVLSTWDEAIQATAELIKAKERQKSALTQKLLSGKVRLKGFTENWKEIKLEEAFSERNERGILGLPLLSIGASGVYPQSDSIKKDTSNEDKSKYLRICPGDIGYNTMRMWQGRSALSQLEGIVSPAYTILKPRENINSLYFAYLFKTEFMIHQFFRNSQGLVDDTLNCKYRDLSIIKVSIPAYKEQIAIASVLQTADKELKLLKTKLDSLKEQKKGLMQQLLTGKKRLKINQN